MSKGIYPIESSPVLPPVADLGPAISRGKLTKIAGPLIPILLAGCAPVSVLPAPETPTPAVPESLSPEQQRLAEKAISFMTAAQQGKLVYFDGATATSQGTIADVLHGTFGVDQQTITADIETQLTLPAPETITDIPLANEQSLVLKTVTVPTNAGSKVLLFLEQEGSWHQLGLVTGQEEGISISQQPTGISVDSPASLALTFDSGTNPSFNALVAANNRQEKEAAVFASAIYVLQNANGEYVLVYLTANGKTVVPLPPNFKIGTGTGQLQANFGPNNISFIPTIEPPPPTATPAPTATPTETPIPTLPPELVGGLEGVPDPKITNPELFDLKNPNAPIPLFVNAMKMAGIEMTGEEVVAGLHPQLETPQGLPPFLTLRTTDGYALIMAQQNPETGKWEWEKATPGTYWSAQGKYVGIYLTRRNVNDYGIEKLTTDLFSGSVLATNGQLQTYDHRLNIVDRSPNGILARDLYQIAENAGSTVYLHFIAEPDRFPPAISTKNVDEWLRGRFSDVAKAIKNHHFPKPTILEFNEAFHFQGQWSPGRNPIKDKYGEKWLEEYLYQLMASLMDNNLIPNIHFIPSFNEYEIYNDPTKQKVILKKILNARIAAYQRLVETPQYAVLLAKNGINRPEDLKILLGLQDPLKYGQLETFFGSVNQIADEFSGLGGVILTELNPKLGQLPNNATKEIFLIGLVEILKENPNIRGALLWNLFTTPKQDPSFKDLLKLVDLESEKPTKLYYELLK